MRTELRPVGARTSLGELQTPPSALGGSRSDLGRGGRAGGYASRSPRTERCRSAFRGVDAARRRPLGQPSRLLQASARAGRVWGAPVFVVPALSGIARGVRGEPEPRCKRPQPPRRASPNRLPTL